jgi:hypothetical protein
MLHERDITGEENLSKNGPLANRPGPKLWSVPSKHGLSDKCITGECAVTRSDGWAQDHAGVVEDFLKFGSGELSPGERPPDGSDTDHQYDKYKERHGWNLNSN